MNLGIVVLLLAYSVGVSVALLARGRRSDGRETADRIGSDLATGDEVEKLQKLDLMLRLGELQAKLSPWYERSISTIGVFAFIAMAVASAVQTVAANTAQASAKSLEQRVGDLRVRSQEAEDLLFDVAGTLLSLGWSGEELEDQARSLLSYRLEALEAGEEGDRDTTRERYAIYLALGNYAEAVDVLEGNIDLINEAEPADLVTLAEYYYLTGAESRARELVGKIQGSASDFERSVRLRLLSLEVVVGAPKERDRLVVVAAALLRVSRADAERVLARRAQELRSGRVGR